MQTHTNEVAGLIEPGEVLRTLTEGAPGSSRARRGRGFHVGIAVAFVLTAIAGFGPSYAVGRTSSGLPTGPLLHLHAGVFGAWLVLLLVQTTLVSSRRVRLHMRLGIAGALLAAVMVPVGIMTAIEAARAGSARPGMPPLVFLAVPMGQIAIFAGLVGAALWQRRRPELHRRLMLLANVSLITPAIARLPWVGPRPILALGCSALFVVAAIVHNRRVHGRVHPVYLWGGLALIASGPLRVALAHTEAWQVFARWLVA